ncbi:MAG TPA: (Fe-S)-binding protein [Chloroflexota bacterium]|nr:(Fe-S)-binding protein [Chloroflexota bacterium]
MLACIRCGLCLTSCPTYVLSLDESEGPRGRVGMARALAEGQLDVTPVLVEHELNCLVCDACTAVCPAGVHMDPLQVALRAALESDPRSAVGPARRRWRVQLTRRLVFGWLFMDLARFRLLARVLWLYQRLGARWLARHLGILRLLGLERAEALLPDLPRAFVIPHDEVYAAAPGAAVPALASPSVASMGPPTPGTERSVGPAGSPGSERSAGAERSTGTPAAFFAGCVMSTALAEIDRATIRVLQRAGFELRNPARQGCCGALHAHGGDVARAMQLAKANIAAFEDTAGPIVVNSAGCGAMLKDYAHHLRLDPEWSEGSKVFSARVRDFSEVLADRPLPITQQLHAKVVVQDACHLLHAQRVSRQPRDLLRRIPGVALAEIDEPGLCCGSAGVYNITNPVQSRQLQQRKLDNALAACPAVIVTTNPGCLLQLKSGLAERRGTVRVVHLAEVLDEASRP